MDVLQEYKCPSCGGSLSFDSKTQNMKCPYCGSEIEVEALKELDSDLFSEQEDEMEWDTSAKSEWQGDEADGVAVYSCESCGGEIIAEDTTVATSCPFCGNAVVVKRKLSGELRPDLVIPFKLDKAEAKEGFFKHLKNKKLLPKFFKDESRIDEIKGVYVPFWLFCADADANIQYDATKVRVWSDTDYNYTRTSHYRVLRGGKVSFSQVPVDGSEKMPDDMMESLEPYDMNEAVDFQTAYLAGYLADKYDVDADASIKRANQRIKTSTEQIFASTVIGYSSVRTRFSNVKLSGGTSKYALLPVWLLNSTYKGEKYTFAMNGQTGKFVGDLPISEALYWKWVGIYAAIAVPVVFGLTALLLML